MGGVGSDTIRVLFLAANPHDTGRLALDREMREIQAAIRDSRYRDTIALVSQWAVRPRDLQRTLLEHEPHIVHFSGHGEEQSILLMGDDGQARPVAGGALARMFATHKGAVRAVVFNACFSEEQALAVTDSIDFAIGMAGDMKEESAVAFSTAFYMGLGYGRSIPDAFDIGVTELAVRELDSPAQPVLLRRQDMDDAQAAALLLPAGTRQPREPITAPATPPRPPSQRFRSRTALLLDRNAQWDRIQRLCASTEKPVAFVVHGRSAHDVELFCQRIQHVLNEECETYHNVHRLLFQHGYTTAETADDWEAELRRVLSAGRQDLSRALARAASGQGLMLILDKAGPLRDLDEHQTQGLAEFLGQRLPALVKTAGQNLLLRVLVPLEHRGKARKDPLYKAAHRALSGAKSIAAEILVPLEFPPWGEVEAFLRHELKVELDIRDESRIESFIDQCDDLYQERFAGLPEGERNFSELVEALDRELRQLARPRRLPTPT